MQPRKKESFGMTQVAWFCMETTVAGCLVLKEATSDGGHGRDSRPGNVCDLAVLTPHHTVDVSLLSVWHFTSKNPYAQRHTHTHTQHTRKRE